MKKRSSITRTIADERGTVLILTVFLVILFMVLTVGVVEYGKYRIYNEKMQTAADAASVAAATSEVHRWVRIEVFTDRGSRTKCDKDSCWCEDCGITSRITPWMEEKYLIEGGDWEMFCYPPCDCGGGDCWFEVVDRKVTYDITSRTVATTPQEVDRFKSDMTEAVYEALSARAYPYSGKMYEFVRGKGLEHLVTLLSSSSYFVDSWLSKFLPYYNPRLGCYENFECYLEYTQAYQVYNKLHERNDPVEWINRVIDSTNRYASLLNYTGSDITPRRAQDTADYYYMLNAPDNSDISRVVVHDKQNDPYYPSVTVYAIGRMQTTMADLAARLTGSVNTLTSLKAGVCSQGTTYYRSPDDQTGTYTGAIRSGKWSPKPAESCWLD